MGSDKTLRPEDVVSWAAVNKQHLQKMKADLAEVCTHADIIRSMNDYDLAKAIVNGMGAAYCSEERPRKCKRTDIGDMTPCEVCAYEWLKKPAEM